MTAVLVQWDDHLVFLDEATLEVTMSSSEEAKAAAEAAFRDPAIVGGPEDQRTLHRFEPGYIEAAAPRLSLWARVGR